MACADPLPLMFMATSSPTVHSSTSAFSRYNHSTRRAVPPRSEVQSPPFSLEAIALLLDRGSPTEDLAYLTADYYSTSSSIVRTSGEISSGGGRPFQKSRSFPKVKRDAPLKSCVQNEKLLRRAKSVRFADTQGLPLIEAIHQLSVEDSSYTENKIVPYSENCEFQPVQLVSCRRSKDPRDTSAAAAAAEVVSPKPTTKPPHSLLVLEPSTPPPLVSPPPVAPLTRQLSPPAPAGGGRRVFRFSQPGSEPGFYDRVNRDCVVLESVRDEPRMIRGVVRVLNITFHKEVMVRWSHDRWRSYHDTSAVFSANDGHTDRFTFELPANGEDIEFALRYKCDGKEYWDSNRGKNYSVEGSR